MELWIRSQDKKALIPISKMITNTCEGLFYDGIILGMYKTERRALEILDEISDELISANYMPLEENEKITCGSARIYEMPKE